MLGTLSARLFSILKRVIPTIFLEALYKSFQLSALTQNSSQSFELLGGIHPTRNMEYSVPHAHLDSRKFLGLTINFIFNYYFLHKWKNIIYPMTIYDTNREGYTGLLLDASKLDATKKIREVISCLKKY